MERRASSAASGGGTSPLRPSKSGKGARDCDKPSVQSHISLDNLPAVAVTLAPLHSATLPLPSHDARPPPRSASSATLAASLVPSSQPPSSPLTVSDGSNECLPLPTETDSGRVEYKWKLLNKSKARITQLTSQMKYRMHEGGGSCLYELGVLDNGYPEGLTEAEMDETLGTVRDMARELRAEVRVIKTAKGKRGQVAEVEVREGSRSSVVDVRVAVIGNEQSGKSTLVGVLCSGRMDNGRGSARMNVFRHRHEVESGHTSSLSSQLLGFDEAGRVINTAGSSPSPSSFSSHSWSGITDRASKVITFSDLVGHESGAKVTTSALLADAVDYALIVISAQEGLTAMDREYLGMCEGLGIRMVVVLSKVDLVTETRVAAVVSDVEELLAGLAAADGEVKALKVVATEDGIAGAVRSDAVVPLFTVSSVTGQHIDLFSSFLFTLPPPRNWTAEEVLPACFSIDSIYSVDDTSIVGGLLVSGHLLCPQRLLLGPLGKEGRFAPVTVTSMHVRRRDVRRVEAGQSASLGLDLGEEITHSQLRRGLILCDEKADGMQSSCYVFDAVIALSSPPDPLHLHYQPILYMTNIRQSAMLLSMRPLQPTAIGEDSNGSTTTAPTAPVEYEMRFRWRYYPEHVQVGYRVVLREGPCRGIGRVTRIYDSGHDGEEKQAEDAMDGGSPLPRRKRERGGRRQQQHSQQSQAQRSSQQLDTPLDSPLSNDGASPFALQAMPGSILPHSASLPELPPPSAATDGRSMAAERQAALYPALLRTLSPTLQQAIGNTVNGGEEHEIAVVTSNGSHAGENGLNSSSTSLVLPNGNASLVKR